MLVIFLLNNATLYILQDMQHSLFDVKLMRLTFWKYDIKFTNGDSKILY